MRERARAAVINVLHALFFCFFPPPFTFHTAHTSAGLGGGAGGARGTMAARAGTCMCAHGRPGLFPAGGAREGRCTAAGHGGAFSSYPLVCVCMLVESLVYTFHHLLQCFLSCFFFSFFLSFFVSSFFLTER